jgi:hypothetical protein
MLYREKIAVCSEIHTKHINTVCGQKLGLLNANPFGYRKVKEEALDCTLWRTRFGRGCGLVRETTE